jgi:hypothetical protein
MDKWLQAVGKAPRQASPVPTLADQAQNTAAYGPAVQQSIPPTVTTPARVVPSAVGSMTLPAGTTGGFKYGSVKDLAAQAMKDRQALIAQREASRQVATDAMTQIRGTYGTAAGKLEKAADEMGESTVDINRPRDLARGRFDEAWQTSRDTLAQTAVATGAQTERALQFRKEALTDFTDTMALRADTLRRGAESQMDASLRNIDDAMAQGRIQGQGNVAASQVAAQMKAQVKQQYQDQLRGAWASMAVDEAKTRSTLRATIDQYTLAATQAATQTQAGMRVDVGNTQAKLAADQAASEAAFLAEMRLRDMGRSQMLMAAAQLRATGAETIADIMMSDAFMPDAEILYPLAEQLFTLSTAVADRKAAAEAEAMAARAPVAIRGGGGGRVWGGGGRGGGGAGAGAGGAGEGGEKAGERAGPTTMPTTQPTTRPAGQ